jgi:tetratricopeptide (TPR) repeat protein
MNSPATTDHAPLRLLWQVPALIVATIALFGALSIAVFNAPAPDFERMLKGVEVRIDHEEYDEALRILNNDVLAYVDHADFTPDDRRMFHILRARAIFYAQQALGLSREDNYNNVIAEYQEAERRNAQLQPQDVHLFAKSLIGAGQLDRALERAASMSDPERNRRIAILKDVVLAKMSLDHRDADGALALLAQLILDNRLSPNERAWAVARQTELLIEDGYEDDAIAKVLRALPRLPGDTDPSAIGELSMLLGRAYLATGNVDEAVKHLERALTQLLPAESRRADTLVLLGQCDERRAQYMDARDRFLRALDEFGSEPAALSAMLGLGRVQAMLGDNDLSYKTYQQLVDSFKEGDKRHPGVDVELIGADLLARVADRLAADRNDQALEYARLAEDLYTIDAAPDDVIRALADTNRRLAEERLGDIGTGLDRIINLSELDPATREQARRNYIAAGSYYSIFADRVSISDNEEYANSLWYAADSFDAGGDREMAIQGFQRYANEIPDDPRRPEAKFRLAQAYQAMGEYTESARLYLELINASDDRDAGRGVGPFAQASYVPLAQTYLLDLDESNDADAEQLLRRITSGTLGTAEATYFREGLITLGRLFYQTGRYVEAIERLEDACARYQADDRFARIAYLLADSYRLEADAISRTLQDAMPDHEKRAFKDQQRSHLRRALELYDVARASIEAKDDRRLTPVEKIYLRNAYFYLGACAFDLGDYDAAIVHYNIARERFPKDPSSLVAMIQIVHAYMAQGQITSARTANERAKRFYESLPVEAWDDPSLPMRRADWERWLDLTANLDGVADAGTP